MFITNKGLTFDAHLKGIDRELTIWGDHAIAGTKGAEVIPELKVSEKDFIVPKRRYSGFFQTNLDILLTELGVKTVIMTGLHTHMCVRHTSADAFCLGYDVVAAKEATDSFTEEDYKAGLAYLKTCYGADAYTTRNSSRCSKVSGLPAGGRGSCAQVLRNSRLRLASDRLA